MIRIAESARKHGITDEDIRHAWRTAFRVTQVEYDGEERLLILGPTTDGIMLELIAVPADQPTQIIHADKIRPKFTNFL